MNAFNCGLDNGPYEYDYIRSYFPWCEELTTMTKGQSRVCKCLHDTDPVLIKVEAADITGHGPLNGFTQGVH